ncbi:hypothetical protein MICRO8M_80525 [Microbacterium sp. 8M]|uniref:hypothetical protein n=1 Tax=Microbacterium sp. 8M TaxID=2653153 RepID=UPI0012F3489A|nr:hypothetical protein [Microbacterium sp. 8M]VXC26860.1 hypothetical protein MICRO8M_80525 [Microbacterium sp. 8M]
MAMTEDGLTVLPVAVVERRICEAGSVPVTLDSCGWRITRHRTEGFVLHDRGGGQTVLHPRLPLRYAWGDVDPPLKRFRPAA